ncbi:MAG: hypothetical protein ACXW1B_06215 [Nitrososphaeraceae archaeon]
MNNNIQEFTTDDEASIEIHMFDNNYTRQSFLAKFGFDFFTEEPSEEDIDTEDIQYTHDYRRIRPKITKNNIE